METAYFFRMYVPPSSAVPTPLLPVGAPLRPARLLRREKRFIIHAILEDGTPVTAHTNNTGSMLGLLRPGSKIWLSPAANSHRKLAWTLEFCEQGGLPVGVNTLTPNRLLAAAWAAGALPELAGYDGFRPEAKVGESRLDACLDGPGGTLWVECKNVTLVEDGAALFPDAATERGRRHLRELMALARDGDRVALFFCIQRTDAGCFAPAECVDPEYAELFYEALAAGVEAWPYAAPAHFAPAPGGSAPIGVGLGARLPVRPLRAGERHA